MLDVLFLRNDGTFFRRLPFKSADRLIMLWESDRETGVQHSPVTDGAYELYRERLTKGVTIAAFVPVNPGSPSTTIDEGHKRIQRIYATPELFGLLGAQVVLGRTFLDSESWSGAPEAAILSYRFWRTQYSGRPDRKRHRYQ